jgi:hypothetical protein
MPSPRGAGADGSGRVDSGYRSGMSVQSSLAMGGIGGFLTASAEGAALMRRQRSSELKSRSRGFCPVWRRGRFWAALA